MFGIKFSFGTGLGRERSKFGKWLDKRGITQTWVAENSGVNRKTVGKIASDPDYEPNSKTIKKLLKALRIIDPNVKAEDFWSM